MLKLRTAAVVTLLAGGVLVVLTDGDIIRSVWPLLESQGSTPSDGEVDIDDSRRVRLIFIEEPNGAGQGELIARYTHNGRDHSVHLTETNRGRAADVVVPIRREDTLTSHIYRTTGSRDRTWIYCAMRNADTGALIDENEQYDNAGSVRCYREGR